MEREGTDPREGTRGKPDPENRAPSAVPARRGSKDLAVSAGPGVGGGRLPAPRGVRSSVRLQRNPALRVYCLSIVTLALKAARPPLREGAETERGGEGRGIRTSRERPEKVAFPSGWRVGGEVVVWETPHSPRPPALFPLGEAQAGTCIHPCPSAPSDPLKGRW